MCVWKVLFLGCHSVIFFRQKTKRVIFDFVCFLSNQQSEAEVSYSCHLKLWMCLLSCQPLRLSHHVILDNLCLLHDPGTDQC